jgi:hypothetical protein
MLILSHSHGKSPFLTPYVRLMGNHCRLIGLGSVSLACFTFLKTFNDRSSLPLVVVDRLLGIALLIYLFLVIYLHDVSGNI